MDWELDEAGVKAFPDMKPVDFISFPAVLQLLSLLPVFKEDVPKLFRLNEAVVIFTLPI
jgi:hypothetical protein